MININHNCNDMKAHEVVILIKNIYIRVLYSQRIPFHYNFGHEKKPFVSQRIPIKYSH